MTVVCGGMLQIRRGTGLIQSILMLFVMMSKDREVRFFLYINCWLALQLLTSSYFFFFVPVIYILYMGNSSVTVYVSIICCVLPFHWQNEEKKKTYLKQHSTACCKNCLEHVLHSVSDKRSFSVTVYQRPPSEEACWVLLPVLAMVGLWCGKNTIFCWLCYVHMFVGCGSARCQSS